MNTEREPLLSAYLDGQLGPEERRRVVAALAADPAAAESLRALAGVRDLVAGLSRPAGPDLAPAVLNQLNRQNLKRRGWRTGAMIAGAAASLLGLALAGERLLTPTRPNPIVAPPPVVAQAPDIAPTPPVQAEPPAPAPAVAIAAAEPSGGASHGEEPSRSPIAMLLDGSQTPLVFRVSDRDGPAARERVAGLLGLSSHRDFHRIEPPPAKIDGDGEPAQPSAADPVVFAATLDPSELTTFRDRLATAFPGRINESDADRTLVAGLVDRGRVSTLPASPAGDVSFPQTNLAMQFPTQGRRNWPEPAQDADRNAADDAKQPQPQPAGGEGPRSILVVVVATAAD